MSDTKCCTYCKEELPLSSFATNTTRGRTHQRSRCKECEAFVDWLRRNPGGSRDDWQVARAKRMAKRARVTSAAAKGLKHCTVCEQDKPKAAFHRDSTKPDGYTYACGDCLNSQYVDATNPQDYCPEPAWRGEHNALLAQLLTHSWTKENVA